MSGNISCRELAELMRSNSLYAVIDVRERGEFNDGQIPNATSLPRSQIEFRLAGLVPNANIPIIVYDEGRERATLAAKTLIELGYEQTSVLDGGLTAWQEDGGPTASGLNVPSKTFGEKVHSETHVPEITPEELDGLRRTATDLMILDVRTPEEYGRFCIPGGLNVPGGDLILWAEELKRYPDRSVVVNCAGRTRSIIGTAALRRLGVNHVRALKNGTMGWVLAGFALESKPAKESPAVPDESRDQARAAALRLAEEEQIPLISPQELSNISLAGADTVVYFLDVRSENEYEAGHIPGSLSLPGGQAVQRVDDFVAVRNGRIVFISNQSSRAMMAAYWYKRMGYQDVRVLRGGLEAWRANSGSVISGWDGNDPLGLGQAREIARMITAEEAEGLVQSECTMILDVGSSRDYEAAHIPGAKWISRGWLEIKLSADLADKGACILLSCRNGRHSILAAYALEQLGYRNAFVLSGGINAWSSAGFPTETGLAVCLSEPNDVVLSPSVRGNKEDMRRYLDWEMKLAARSG